MKMDEVMAEQQDLAEANEYFNSLVDEKEILEAMYEDYWNGLDLMNLRLEHEVDMEAQNA